MFIVDVDAHQEPAPDWLDDVPLLKDQLVGRKFPESDPQIYLEAPSRDAAVEVAAFGFTDGVQARRRPDRRVPLRTLATPFMEEAFGVGPGEPAAGFVYEGADQHQPIDAERRVRWLDEAGIAIQTLIPLKGLHLASRVEDPLLGMRAIEHLNTYLSERLDGYTDRLNVVTSLRYENIEWAVRELTRMRARGSRSFYVPGGPVRLVPPYDAYFDPVWAAACDLGMIGVLHIGAAPIYDGQPGWVNTDDPSMLRYLATTNMHGVAVMMLNSLVFGGVFERFPDFALQISEFGLGWLPFTLQQMDGKAGPAGQRLVGRYSYTLKPSEFVRRNVRISGLPGQDSAPVLEIAPECLAFASDYPHFEGTPRPVEYYLPNFETCEPGLRNGYFGRNMLDAYARMGQPLVEVTG
jgi:predicted TIM-barrel fold metal-dependent hydrolase